MHGEPVPSHDEPAQDVRNHAQRGMAVFRRIDLPTWTFMVYLFGYGLVSSAVVSFYPSYSAPGGDEATYYSYAMHPWTLRSDFFEGYPPKEAISPYAFRLFLAPFSLLFATVGFTYVGARLIVLAYGLILLALWYAIGRRLASGWVALGVVIAVSWSPRFWFHTHGVRPEGMLTLWLTASLWLMLRRERPTAWTWWWIGLLSASGLWIHYNGVVLFPLLFGAMLVYDWPYLTRRKLLAYGAAGVTFGALFVTLNLWPARETLQSYGIMPVTFVSSNQVPVLHGREGMQFMAQAASYYWSCVRGLSTVTDVDVWGLPVFMFVAVTAVLIRPRRQTTVLLYTLVVLAAVMICFLPNARRQYLMYLFGPLVPLVAYSLGQIARIRFVGGLAVAILLAAIGLDNYRATEQFLGDALINHSNNRRVGVAMRGLINAAGRPADVTVMGSQEFHAFAADTRFRTFHSLIATGDVGAVVEQIDPDIILLHQRGLSALATFLLHSLENSEPREATTTADVFSRNMHRIYYRDATTGDALINVELLQRIVHAELVEAGYAEVVFPEGDYLTWNGQPVTIYVKPFPRASSFEKRGELTLL